jgi:hypothetical protein
VTHGGRLGHARDFYTRPPAGGIGFLRFALVDGSSDEAGCPKVNVEGKRQPYAPAPHDGERRSIREREFLVLEMT